MQVKTQSFDAQNRWNYLGSDTTHFDRLVLVVLTDTLTVRDLYDVPVPELLPLLCISHHRGGDRLVYYWDRLAPWRVQAATLPGYAELRDLIEDATACPPNQS